MPNVGVGYDWKDQAVMAFGGSLFLRIPTQLNLALPLGMGRVSHAHIPKDGTLSYFLGSGAEEQRAVTHW